MADAQTLQGVAASLSVTWLDALGEPATPVGTVTVGVATADGTEVLPAGTATTGTAETRAVAIPAADTADLGWLVATWTDSTTGTIRTTVTEIVGGFYFTVAQARAVEPSLADPTKYPNAAIQQARAEVEAEFEAICERAFVPRYERSLVQLGRHGVDRLLLIFAYPRFIRAVTSDGTAWTQAQIDALALDASGLIRCAYFAGQLTIAYEHGMDRPPAEIVRAAIARTRYRLNVAVAGIPDRATSFTVTEGGTYRLATAGVARVGVDWIDAALDRWSLRTPGVA